MERELSQFSQELLEQMRTEEREKFLAALKNGASWVQLYKIRNTIRRLNELIESAAKNNGQKDRSTKPRSEDEGPRR